MFVFGVCVETQEVFDRHCLPAIAAFGGSDATLITSTDKPIAATYNQMLQAAVDMDDVEAVVLLRPDVEITDPRFLTKVRAAFARDSRLGVLGPAQATGIGGTERLHPSPAGARSIRTPGNSGSHEVDFVDGLCMILRPQLAARLRFDASAFTGASGYDVDFCFRAREAGFTVAVEPLGVLPHEGHGPSDAFRSAAAAWQGQRAARLGQATLRRIALRPPPAEREPAHGSPGHLPGPESGYDFHQPELLAHLPDEIDRVLQVGCGAGTLGAAIKEVSGAHVTGIEHNPAAARLARERLDEVHEVDLTGATDLGWQPEPFDVIVLSDILARLADPAATLRLLAPHLRPDGLVIATLPNVKHWTVLLPLLLHDRWEYQDSGPLAHSHLRFFTMAEAATLFREAGLGTFDACIAEQIPLEDESGLEPLLEAVTAYGGSADEVRTLLNAYQYVIVARPTGADG